MVYVLSLVILILLILLIRKRKFDNTLEAQEAQLQYEIEKHLNTINKLQTQIAETQEQYHTEMSKRAEALDVYFENQKQLRQSEIDTYFDKLSQERQEKVDLNYNQLVKELQQQEIKEREKSEQVIKEIQSNQQAIVDETKWQQERFEALLIPLQQYEKEKQERLFYTIQVPEEYKEDIEFLLTNVANKVQHPDIINKLVWAEYVKPYIDDTFKRVGIEDKPGIYKLTSLINGKCYIGKSTNIKKRISDHYKSVVGISTIADQAVHHAIAQEGYWNWTIEPIIYCEKDKLNELEKYYISFFKSNSFGYNITKGGEG